MERLTPSQLRKLLSFLEGLAAVGEQEAFVQYLLVSAPDLIPCEILTYNEMVPSQRTSRNWVTPSEVLTSESHAIWAQHMHEHPTLMHTVKTKDGQARMVSDFLSPLQLHRLGLYNELYREWHVEDILTAVISLVSDASPTMVVGLGFYRNRRTFSERDRLLLNLLRPHLVQTYARVGAHTRLRDELVRTKQVLEAIDQGVIVLSRDGSARKITRRARRLLTAYWGPAAARRLPPELQEWMRHQRAPMPLAEPDGPPAPARPLVVEREGGRLIVRLAGSSTAEHLLILEEQQTLSPSAFSSLGLTDRESEVLLWVSFGKTDAEIATILGVSPKTVGKHLERIYQKLGVENRTAAGMRALTCLPTR